MNGLAPRIVMDKSSHDTRSLLAACLNGASQVVFFRRTLSHAVLVALFLPVGLWAEDRLDSSVLARMDLEIRRAIEDRKIPGGVLWVESKGAIHHRAHGFRAVSPTKERMTVDTLFDVASLTKVMATAPSIMMLQERGKLKVDDPVSRFLPEFKAGGKDSITLRHLLTHTSGLGRSLGRTPDWSNREAMINELCAEAPSSPPGAVHLYSDLNYILLAEVVQRVSGVSLDVFARKEIFAPLGMRDTFFAPAPADFSRIAPTDRSGRIAHRGLVHDPKARAMNRASGHAGVFTTAADLARFARMMLRKGELDGFRLLRADSVEMMVRDQTSSAIPERRGLGWDIDTDFSRPRGELFPIGSYGHTGFTGASIWIDPFSQSFCILLSNRVHTNPNGNIYALQKALGTLAAKSIKGFDFSVHGKGGAESTPSRKPRLSF